MDVELETGLRTAAALAPDMRMSDTVQSLVMVGKLCNATNYETETLFPLLILLYSFNFFYFLYSG